jgi:hypothetical protein
MPDPGFVVLLSPIFGATPESMGHAVDLLNDGLRSEAHESVMQLLRVFDVVSVRLGWIDYVATSVTVQRDCSRRHERQG